MKKMFFAGLLVAASAFAGAQEASVTGLSCAPDETFRQMRVQVSEGGEILLISLGHAYPAEQVSGRKIRRSGVYELCLKSEGRHKTLITGAKRVQQ